jgi:hypothetical protein
MDFIEGLPASGSTNCILVVIDKFTKLAHFLPLKHPYTALSVAKAFLNQVYKLHGLSESIISDRDPIFASTLWKELFALARVQLRFSTAYHPRSNGQTKRVNQCLKTFLRCFVSSCPKEWLTFLTLAEFWYNTSYHTIIGCSPFEAMYGRSPRTFGLSAVSNSFAVGMNQWLPDRQAMTALVKQQLNRAVLRMKFQADKNRSERHFDARDWVFLKLQPYVQSSLAPRANQKLAFKFFGPFQILQKIGQVAYKLALPESSSLHPVFHVSQL